MELRRIVIAAQARYTREVKLRFIPSPERSRPIMSKVQCRHLNCTVVVLAISESELQGDPISEALRAELLEAVDRCGAHHVVLDFQHVTFVSSVAFRPLLSLHRKLKERGGRLVLCGMKERVAEVFHVTRLVSTTGASAAPFELQADAAAAVASLYRNAPGQVR